MIRLPRVIHWCDLKVRKCLGRLSLPQTWSFWRPNRPWISYLRNPDALTRASQAVVAAQQLIKTPSRRVDNLLTSSDPDDIDQAKANLVWRGISLIKALEDYDPYDKNRR